MFRIQKKKVIAGLKAKLLLIRFANFCIDCYSVLFFAVVNSIKYFFVYFSPKLSIVIANEKCKISAVNIPENIDYGLKNDIAQISIRIKTPYVNLSQKNDFKAFSVEIDSTFKKLVLLVL